jgi:transcriptional regulator with XRE-family HTH domain
LEWPVYLCVYKTKPLDMHRGEYIKQKVKEYGFTAEKVLAGLDITRTTLYKWFADENLPIGKMKSIADVIKFDLRPDFPETEMMYKEEQPKDYRMLYLKELEKNRNLEEQMEQYRLKSKN